MNPRLLDHYNRELQHLREMGGEFAAAYPKIAGRLALDGFDCGDPYVERLLEGFAFLAARVQLKFEHGYERFTQHLLDTVYPGLLAPLPSMLVAQFEPDLRDPSLAAGCAIPRGSALHARLAPDEQTACEFRSAHEVMLWPLALRSAQYLPRADEIAALGIVPLRGAQAGLRLIFDVTAGLCAGQLALERLPLFLQGSGHVPARLHEQLLGHALGFVLRDADGPAGVRAQRQARAIRAPGFDDNEALLPPSPRGFSGHRLLQEYFAFPGRFRFVEFGELRAALAGSETAAFEIVVQFDRNDAALERAVDASAFALHCTPAINLFPKRADRVLLSARDHEHHLVADRARPMDFEVHSVSAVTGHGSGAAQPFTPFYAVGRGGQAGAATHFSVHRVPRLVSQRQQRKGARSSYLGSEVFLSLVDACEAPLRSELRELAVDTLCTNRDLPLLMPLGGSGDFTLDAAAPVLGIRCLQGPSRPRPPHDAGASHWRLINQLAFNYLSVVDSAAHGGAGALRDLLALHADAQDVSAARLIEGVRGVSQQAVHRRLPSPGPICFGRGLEITLSCDEAAFEGSGAFLLGAVLEQFLARHSSVNAFTETVLRSTTRGEIMRWPARLGKAAAMLSLYRELEEAPQRFGFFEALRRVQQATPELPRIGTSARPAEDALRLGQPPSLSFAPSTLAAFECRDGQPARMTVNCLGLFGPNGALPGHLTEYAHERAHNAGDDTFTRFVDVFHHRMLSLFFRAWAIAEPAVDADLPQSSQYMAQIGALIGIGRPPLRDRDAMPDAAKLHYAGRLGTATRNAEGMEAMVSDLFGVPARVEPCVGEWLDLPQDSRCRLSNDDSAGRLGVNALAGVRVWSAQHRFRLCLGPMNWAAYQRFLPGEDALEKLRAVMRNALGDELAWDLELVLERRGVPQARLGTTEQLGWSAWLGKRRPAEDARDLKLQPHARQCPPRTHTIGDLS